MQKLGLLLRVIDSLGGFTVTVAVGTGGSICQLEQKVNDGIVRLAYTFLDEGHLSEFLIQVG